MFDITLYRIENPQTECGNGPYNGGRNLGDEVQALRIMLSLDHDNSPERPAWSMETWFDSETGQETEGPDPTWGHNAWVAGFASIEQLASWFNETERELLAQCGFKIALYESKYENALLGQHQAAFKIGKSQRRNLIPVSGDVQELNAALKRAARR